MLENHPTYLFFKSLDWSLDNASIAKLVRMRTNRVGTWRRRLGMPQVSVLTYTEIVSPLLIGGASPREIRKIYPEISSNCIGQVRKKLGMPVFRRGRPIGTKDLLKLDLIRSLKIKGKSYREISELFGVSRQCIQQTIRPRTSLLGQKCRKCGSASKLHRHHPDYSTDYIEYLCVSCHAKVHGKVPQRKILTVSNEGV